MATSDKERELEAKIQSLIDSHPDVLYKGLESSDDVKDREYWLHQRVLLARSWYKSQATMSFIDLSMLLRDLKFHANNKLLLEESDRREDRPYHSDEYLKGIIYCVNEIQNHITNQVTVLDEYLEDYKEYKESLK